MAVVMLSAASSSGQTATVTTRVNGGATTTIAPGGSVRVSVDVTHSHIAIAHLAGGTIVDGDVGVASNFATSIPSLPTMNFGSFVGGSRVGADFFFTYFGGMLPTPPSTLNPMPVWSYDLTLEAPGEYHITWVPSPFAPSVSIWTMPVIMNPVPAHTTIVGATITVTPGPASLWVAVSVGLLCWRRSRPNGGDS